MKMLTVLLVLTCGFVRAQDWTPCKTAMTDMATVADKYNSEHKGGPQLEVSCIYLGDDLPKKPVKHIQLSPKEIIHLRALRDKGSEAYQNADAYENLLIKRHGVRKPEFGDKCWYFVGIAMDDDYITVDPNSGFPNPACNDAPAQKEIE